jgi:predicted GNAT family N-acyltransferase
MINYVEKTPSAEEFNYLTNSVGWGTRQFFIVEEALRNTLYSLCVYDDTKLIGYGRIIGDKTIFLYIQDIIVIPKYQNKHIGTNLMKNLLNQINEYKKINPDIRTYLGASKGKESFYEKFGFISRPNKDLGSGMILY